MFLDKKPYLKEFIAVYCNFPLLEIACKAYVPALNTTVTLQDKPFTLDDCEL
jgi:hypothetical protein